MKFDKETVHLSAEENQLLHSAFIKSLKFINEFFDAAYAARRNMGSEVRVANNVLSTFRGIRQSESGHEMVILQRAKMYCETKKESKEYLDEYLPHINLVKKLKACMEGK